MLEIELLKPIFFEESEKTLNTYILQAVDSVFNCELSKRFFYL